MYEALNRLEKKYYLFRFWRSNEWLKLTKVAIVRAHQATIAKTSRSGHVSGTKPFERRSHMFCGDTGLRYFETESFPSRLIDLDSPNPKC